MQLKFIFASVGILLILCSSYTKTSTGQEKMAPTALAAEAASPLNGAWEIYSTEAGGKTTFHKKPSQFKIYNDGFFCIMMYDATGKFNAAGAGTYELDGNMYKETVTYSSDPSLLGASLWFDWAMKNDTLIFHGFKKVVLADGKDVTQEWGGDSFMEKKVRAKK